MGCWGTPYILANPKSAVCSRNKNQVHKNTSATNNPCIYTANNYFHHQVTCFFQLIIVDKIPVILKLLVLTQTERYSIYNDIEKDILTFEKLEPQNLAFCYINDNQSILENVFTPLIDPSTNRVGAIILDLVNSSLTK